MKIVLAGSGGLLGGNFLLTALQDGHDVVAIYHRSPILSNDCLTVRADLSDKESVLRIIGEHKPDWVVNCVALTDIDYCQKHPQQSDLINVKVPAYMAEACAGVGAGFVYISSDAIFDGKRGGYAEADVPAPVNEYAKGKWQGEKASAELNPRSLILRTNIFGWNTKQKVNLAEWIVNTLDSGKSLKGFTDTIFNPLLVNDLSRVILAMISKNLTGMYHLGAADACSKHDFALKIAAAFGLDASLIEEALLHEVNFQTPRPLNTTLKVGKAEAALGFKMPGIDQSIGSFKRLRGEPFYARLRELSVGATNA